MGYRSPGARARLSLAVFVVGAVACKKDADPVPGPSTSSAGRGGAGASPVESTEDEASAPSPDRPALPAMPRKLPGTLPDHAELKTMRDERRKQVLEMYDVDKNGELDDDEREAMHEARIVDMVSRIDQNADGKLTREELESSSARRRRSAPDFDVLDVNKDGFVTVEEMAASRLPMRGRGRPAAP